MRAPNGRKGFFGSGLPGGIGMCFLRLGRRQRRKNLPLLDHDHTSARRSAPQGFASQEIKSLQDLVLACAGTGAATRAGR
ncbi:hypothetical protein [Dyella sp.]|uniref:hypothetical protein n=1 Tax=Dyella sp. TaxID=1869338 RepID=UPI002D780334|nr:hypothetical protein [Dyella sp.]HET6431071.1 hypothetical protein [Dyella sp.]